MAVGGHPRSFLGGPIEAGESKVLNPKTKSLDLRFLVFWDDL
jgi:hypothetical protein